MPLRNGVDIVGVSYNGTMPGYLYLCPSKGGNVHTRKKREKSLAGVVSTPIAADERAGPWSLMAAGTMVCLKFYRSTSENRYESRVIVI